MADEKLMKQALMVYETACKALDARDWHYNRHDEDLTLTFGARGEDLPMDMILRVRPEVEVISLISPLPYRVGEEKRMEVAAAVCVANYSLINGCFDLDMEEGRLLYRMVSSFRGSLIGQELIDYMVYVSASTVDEYNDKFFMVDKGMLSLKDFIAWEKRDR